MNNQAKKITAREKAWIRSRGFYQSREWVSVRTEAMRRADYKCQHAGCFEREGLVAHHIFQRWDYPDRALDLTNLIVYCGAHHEEHHHWIVSNRKWTRVQAANDAQFELPFEQASRS